MNPTDQKKNGAEGGEDYPCLEDDRLAVRWSGKIWKAVCSDARRVLRLLFGLCAVFVVADLAFLSPAVDKHAHYGWENWVGFYAVFGFVACTVLVLVAKYIVRPLVARDEDYYD